MPRRPASLGRGTVPLLTIALVLLAALAVGVALVRTVGLQYDEALFVNGAIDPDTSQFVTVRLGPVPIMLMDYIGALKAWVFAPVFAVFGVSLESIRLPMVLLFLATIAVAARFLWSRTSPWFAALAAVLLATEPAFTMMSRDDWGPVAISGFLRVVLAVAIVAVAEGARRRWIAVAVVATALGLFNKLDFAIGALGVLLAALVAFAPQWRVQVRRRPARFVVGAAGLIGAFAAAAVFIYLPTRGTLRSFDGTLLERIMQRLQLVWSTYRGSFVTEYQTERDPAVHSLGLPAAVAVVVLVAVVAVLARRRRAPLPEAGAGAEVPVIGPGRLTGFFVGVTVAIFAALVAVGEVFGPHHVAALWPFPWLATVTGVAFLVAVRRSARVPRLVATTAVAVAGLLVVVVVGSQTASSAAIARILLTTDERPSIWTFDSAPASAAVEALGADSGPVIVTDWGIANQLIAYDDRDPEIRIVDRWSEAVTLTPSEFLARVEATDGGPVDSFVLVYHHPAHQIMGGTTAAAYALITECRSRGGDNRTLYRGDDLVVRQVWCPPLSGAAPASGPADSATEPTAS